MIDIITMLDVSDVWDRRLYKIWQHAQERHNGALKIKPKNGSHVWRLLSLLVNIVTFGKGFDLVNGVNTTIGSTIYVKGTGAFLLHMDPYERCALISHEIAHADDFCLGTPYARQLPAQSRSLVYRYYVRHVRSVCLYIGYVLLPVPFLYAYVRQRVEIGGFYYTLRCAVTRYEGVIPGHVRAGLRYKFTGSAYGWMATGARARKIVDDLCRQVEKEYSEREL